MPSMSTSVCKGRGSVAHNNRIFTTPNVDQSRTHLNITYAMEPLEVAYQKIFGEELARYNATQKRSDRKIHDYIEHIRNSKNGEKPFYEIVVQVGNKYTCGVLSENGEVAAKILDEYMRAFQKRNPNLYVFNAVLHLDEPGGTPHLHIDYIPIATSYKSGLQIRNSLDKALRQQGIAGTASKTNNATQNWQESEKQALAAVMERYDWERAPESGLQREKLSLSQYKAVMADVEQRVESLPEQIESKPVPMSRDKVIVFKDDLEALELRAKLSTVHEEATAGIADKVAEQSDQYIAYMEQQAAAIQRELAMAEQARQDAAREKARVEAMKLRAGQSLADANTQKAKYEQLVEQQQGLNEAYEGLTKENTTLKAENSRLKQRIEELTAEISRKVEAAVKPLKAQIEALTAKAKNVALGESTLLQAVRYVASRFAGEISGAILGAVNRTGNQWLAEDGYPDLAGVKEDIPNAVAKELRLQLIFRDGDDGRGVYSPKGTFVMQCDSIKEARERFSQCEIRDQTRDRSGQTLG